MARRLYEKVACVFGAGSSGPGWGNGKATAMLFAREGARVLCVDRDEEAAGATVELIHGEGFQADLYVADVGIAHEVSAAIEHCVDRYGRIDVLQYNVGILARGGPVELAVDDWDRVMAVNLRGLFLACKYAIPHMQRQGSGAIVAVGSIAGLRHTGVDMVAYQASKAGMVALMQGVALQHARAGIRANTVIPGLMDTPMARSYLADAYGEDGIDGMIAKRNSQCPTGRMGDAWDVAYASLFLACEESKYITGQTITVDGGITQRIAAPA